MARTALVVEDDPVIRQLISLALTQEDCTVVEAGDGRAALAAVARERPDVILLDIGLPDIDGLTVLGKLKDDTALRAIPVVVVTAWADPDMLRQAMDRGAADYVSKPFAIDDLLARVEATVVSPGQGSAARAPVDTAGGLPSRAHLDIVLERQAAAARRTQRPFGIVLVDVDGFDAFTADHGEAAGDDLLRAIAKRFRRHSGGSDVIARHDRHTLAIVAPGLDAVAVVARAQDLRADLATAPLDTPTALVATTARFGVTAHEPTERPDRSLLRAEDALRLATAAVD